MTNSCTFWQFYYFPPEKLPDDDARAPKHVGAAEWSNETVESAFVGYL
jgi:hypothetical protein